MADLGTLRERATKAAKMWGHEIKWQTPYHGESRSNQLGQCTICDAYVAIHTKPYPNEIEIGGSAVAMNCPYIDGVEV